MGEGLELGVGQLEERGQRSQREGPVGCLDFITATAAVRTAFSSCIPVIYTPSCSQRISIWTLELLVPIAQSPVLDQNTLKRKRLFRVLLDLQD